MNRVVCTKCSQEYRPARTGVAVVEMDDQRPPKPYSITYADLLECPKCGHQILANFATSTMYYTNAGFNHYIESRREMARRGDKTYTVKRMQE